jgi:hypothetical protein
VDLPGPERTGAKDMLDILFPQTIDNRYGGYIAGVWLFATLLAVKLAMSLMCVVDGRTVLVSADGIPLDDYAPAPAQTIIALFAIWGVAKLTLVLGGVVVLMRYRAMIPLLFLLFLFEHLTRKLVLQLLPLTRTGNPPGSAVNLGILAIIVAGLACSLLRPRVPAH